MKKKRNRYRKDPMRVGGPIHWIRVLAVCAGFLGLTVPAVAAFSRAYVRILNATIFPVREVEIHGLNVLDRRTILNALGVARGANMLSLHLDELTARLERLAWVRSAEVHLEPGGRLVVWIQERRPVALFFGKPPLLVDEEGVLFAPARPEEHLDLPFLTKVGGMNFQQGDRLPERCLEDFRAFIRAWTTAVEGAVGRLSEVRWDPDDGITVLLNPHGVEVHMGRGDFGQKGKRLEVVLNAVVERSSPSALQAVDLDYPRQAVLQGRWQKRRGI